MDLGQCAKEYIPKTTRNIAEMEVVLLSYPVEQREGKDSSGKPYNYKVVIFNGEEFRVPDSVLSDIQEFQKIKPTLKSVKVSKRGTGMNTTYQVMVIE
jgi:hypothetical protein